ncbi:MAG: flagellar filament capping protein FliD [Verrucomicrobia bacterium]|jgi:flagellar hook-associated protein 2|nr:MAG: flagellar filament capping protein FliD [Verrucomicrobiota bacterium]
MDLGLSGLASNLDWRTLVDQLSNAERVPQTRLRTDQSTIARQNAAYAAIQTSLESLQTRVQSLNSTALFDTRSTTTSDEKMSSATASAGATIASYAFNVTRLATAAKRVGTSDVGSSLNATNDVSGLLVSAAPFATTVTTGTFTVNGKQITIGASDTMQTVFDNIQAATGSEVAASYDSVADRITLSSANPIVLGSATDTSNFLQAAKLNNNSSGTVTSTTQLGVVKLSGALSSANFTTPIADGGTGTGEFKINGVSITFTMADTVTGVLKRINDSPAGVTASYDAVNDRFVMANKVTGDIGVALEDVAGNFLEASGLTTGTLARGQNLLYTVDGGGQMTSQTNTITETSSGITGLSVTALATGASTITVASDTTVIKTAINDFIAEYNKVQSIIDAQTASTTDAKGKVTAGILANEGDADDIGTRLRRAVTGEVSGLAATLNQLEDLGILSNGTDNSVKLDKEAKLDKALAENLTTVRNIFADSSNGLAKKLNTYLESIIGDSGSLITRQANNTKQSAAIDVQIADLERIVLSNRDRMLQSFVAMETAQSNANQQLSFLKQRFGTSSS